MLNVSPTRRAYETLPGLNDPSIPAVAPLPAGETDDTRRIVERFGEDILAAGLHNGQQMIYVKPERLVELAEFLTLLNLRATRKSHLRYFDRHPPR